MCGRYALTMEPESLYGLFEAEPDPRAGGAEGLYGGDPVRPRYNIAPTITVPVVRLEPKVAPDEAHRQIEPMRWGLVPSWAKDLSAGNRMFNARAESLAEKGAFRTALAKRRCLIPASGYFEWKLLGHSAAQPSGGTRKARPKPVKQPYFMTPQDGSVMAFAGLWEYWRPAEGDPVVSMTIITTDSVGPLAGHPRPDAADPAGLGMGRLARSTGGAGADAGPAGGGPGRGAGVAAGWAAWSATSPTTTRACSSGCSRSRTARFKRP